MSEPILCLVKRPWAWFTTAPLDDEWGDDWDDYPFQYNAGEPYGHRAVITKVAFEGAFECAEDGDVERSVADLNRDRAAPWITLWNEREIWAGCPLSEFIAAIQEDGGTVYLAHTKES